ncbi:hypothetical protein JM79_3224 [Gramella sp. Hel_I_59]|uniref:hypothetical protein n=1 Tax=Gramella sp. Hel_I_59 TaxID=1249978 RepID=UPI00114E6F9A|nr:hypothetical protein [Gramella sp. Hel_I_59]TQI72267.1 hypothetical protein JM79_3224 [Gramella sp. Hel_I_59]
MFNEKILQALYAVFFLTGTIITWFLGLDDGTRKFLILGVVGPVISMLMRNLFDASVTKKEVLATYVLACIMVWFGYEIHLQYQYATVLCLIGSFAFGIFSLEIIKNLRRNIPKLIDGITDSAGGAFKKFADNLADWFSNRSKNNKK